MATTTTCSMLPCFLSHSSNSASVEVGMDSVMSSGLMRRNCRGGGRAPLSGSFQSDSGDAESDDLESFAVYGHMMVEPAQGNQIVGVGPSPVCPRKHVV